MYQDEISAVIIYAPVKKVKKWVDGIDSIEKELTQDFVYRVSRIHSRKHFQLGNRGKATRISIEGHQADPIILKQASSRVLSKRRVVCVNLACGHPGIRAFFGNQENTGFKRGVYTRVVVRPGFGYTPHTREKTPLRNNWDDEKFGPKRRDMYIC
ncbi:hypothetical protein WG66_014381 [Moniliophthora roreri]|nr:hypothetical protein WG66_014381 [Moniliophthora roreri]